jgi:putative heme-binding domain-containing protein
MNTLLVRPAWASKVLDAVASHRLHRSDLSASHVQQLRALGDPALTERWSGLAGESGGETKAGPAGAIQHWKRQLTPELLAQSDRSHGRTVYQAICANCHTLNGDGGSIGPDLTGSNRDNLDYLLENILFPSAVVPDAYRQVTLTMKDGRVLAGAVISRTGRTLKLQNHSGTVDIDLAEVAREERSSLSLMPEGLLEAIGDKSARDLIAYLMEKNSSAHQ